MEEMTSFGLLKSQMIGMMVSNYLHGLIFNSKNLRSWRDHLVPPLHSPDAKSEDKGGDVSC